MKTYKIEKEEVEWQDAWAVYEKTEQRGEFSFYDLIAFFVNEKDAESYIKFLGGKNEH